MRRMLTIVALSAALGAGAFASAQPAGATTEPGYQFVVSVRLHDNDITIKGHHVVPRGDVVQFLILNLSKQHRWFLLGGRKTKLLGPNQKYVFFLGFDRRGNYPFKSGGPHVAVLHGVFEVR